MNSLTKGIEYAIQNAIEEFSQLILQKYESVDAEGLEKLWNDVCSEMKISVTSNATPAKVVKKPLSRLTATEKATVARESTAEVSTCPWEITKGDRKGELCGLKSLAGKTMCSRHKNKEDQEPKPKKVIPKAKKSVAAAVAPKKKATSPKVLNRVLRKNKELDVLWHQDTGLVFRSALAKDRVVTGRVVEGEVKELDEEAIELCKKYSFAYEESETAELEDVEGDDVEDVTDTPVAKKAAKEPVKKPVRSRVPAKEVAPKKTLSSRDAKSAKQSITKAIAATKIQTKDVEEILEELQAGDDSDVEEEICEEDEDTPFAEDDQGDDDEYESEDYEEEYLDEDGDE